LPLDKALSADRRFWVVSSALFRWTKGFETDRVYIYLLFSFVHSLA